MPALRLRTLTALVVAALAGGASAAALASDGDGRSQTDTTTGTTGPTTTGTTTTGTTTTGTTTTPGATAPRAPRIAEAEVDSVSGGRLRLRAEVVRRGARITLVRFTYRDRRYTARRASGQTWSRVVAARGGDGAGDVIRFRVTACARSRCSTRTASDEAGRRRGGRYG